MESRGGSGLSASEGPSLSSTGPTGPGGGTKALRLHVISFNCGGLGQEDKMERG